MTAAGMTLGALLKPVSQVRILPGALTFFQFNCYFFDQGGTRMPSMCHPIQYLLLPGDLLYALDRADPMLGQEGTVVNGFTVHPRYLRPVPANWRSRW
jgi:hypothetical protein